MRTAALFTLAVGVASETKTTCSYTALSTQCADERDASALASYSGFVDGCRAVEGVPCSHVIGLSETSCRALCDANTACTHAYFSPKEQGGFPTRAEQDKCVLYKAAPGSASSALTGTACWSKGACAEAADVLPDLVPNEWKALGGADMCIGSAYQKDMAKTGGVAWAAAARMMCTVQSARAACVGDATCAGFVRGFAGDDGTHECYFLTHDQIAECTAHYAHLQGPHSHEANGYVLVREHPYTVCNYGVQFQSKPPTAVSDRECTPITPCSAAHYESQAPTRTSDRVCTPLTTCDAGTQYISVEATETSNRACAPLTTCDYGTQWRSLDATLSSDRVCEPLTDCGAGEGMTSGPTEVSDRVCAPCGGEFEFKADAGNSACGTCPYGYKAAADKRSCFVYMCSHTFCKQEEHHCDFGRERKHRAKSQYNPWHEDKHWEECDGRTFKSLRVYHHGLETNCLSTGHACAMGAVSGDTTKCECGPRPVATKLLLPYESAASTTMEDEGELNCGTAHKRPCATQWLPNDGCNKDTVLAKPFDDKSCWPCGGNNELACKFKFEGNQGCGPDDTLAKGGDAAKPHSVGEHHGYNDVNPNPHPAGKCWVCGGDNQPRCDHKYASNNGCKAGHSGTHHANKCWSCSRGNVECAASSM